MIVGNGDRDTLFNKLLCQRHTVCFDNIADRGPHQRGKQQVSGIRPAFAARRSRRICTCGRQPKFAIVIVLISIGDQWGGF